MFSLNDTMRYFLCPGKTDMRKGMNTTSLNFNKFCYILSSLIINLIRHSKLCSEYQRLHHEVCSKNSTK